MVKVRFHGGPVGGELRELYQRDAPYTLTLPQYDPKPVEEADDAEDAPTTMAYTIVTYRLGRQRDHDGAYHYDFVG